MSWRDAKYLMAYFVPALAALSMYLRGPWVWLVLVVLFVIVPLAEQFMPGTTANAAPEVEQERKQQRLFDVLLYLNVPIQYALLVYFLYLITYVPLSGAETAGIIASMGLCCGVLGINVAHELGHRKPAAEQWMSQALLFTSLYMHFFIEHNRGHHRHVATPLDPATARRGEPIYAFWLRSVRDSWLSAWHLEKERLEKLGKHPFSPDNQMLRFQLVQVGGVLLIAAVFSWGAALAFLLAAFSGALLLETVNYLEHYGLMRREVRPGVYERVQPRHSWNSNRTIGRILLYELTRHSDHHYLASRKYQILRHFEESPELPGGYPAMLLLSLVPPLWFRVMHRELDTYAARHVQAAPSAN
ncbi:MAG: alkane 1-monooxygenase [Bacteroidetes bacterium]|nr:MAG: alkane 1-monooxygenase [Bacteroidota bacterium]